MADVLVSSNYFKHIKDPCVVFDGNQYHIYGSGSKSEAQEWSITHFTAPTLSGVWQEKDSVILDGVCGPRVCAPGIIFDDKMFHMFIQTECFGLDGRIEHAVSQDGQHFLRTDTALLSEKGQEGIYDPHPAIVSRNGKRELYLTYTGMQEVGRGDIFLARSTSGLWGGPWQRLGCILRHEDVPFHNQKTDEGYEWGLEGSQMIQLPDGTILLISVCFLKDKPPGEKQRIVFSLANDVNGPFNSHSMPIVPPVQGWDSAENGHPSAIIVDNTLHLIYQARSRTGPWMYGHLDIPIEELTKALIKLSF